MTRLIIDRKLIGRLKNRAAAAGSEEICGFLLGNSDDETAIVTRLVESPNVARDPARTFEIDPAIHFGIRRRLRQTNDEIVGVYHSHPKGPPVPSRRDLERAPPGEEWVWLILAPEGRFGIAARAFRYLSSEETDSSDGWEEVVILFTPDRFGDNGENSLGLKGKD